MARRLVICAAYAVAMAFVESTVVFYLRLLTVGGAQLFPLTPLPPHLFRAELARELSTIVMLVAVALLQSRRPRIIVAFFVYCFGIWDIFYYVWLKVLIGWPSGLLDWDILFLIPVPWFGPVLSPVIVSLLFVAASLVIISFERLDKPLRFAPYEWAMGGFGAALVIGSYLWELPRVLHGDTPSNYPWWLFTLGCAVWIAAVVRRIAITNRAAPE